MEYSNHLKELIQSQQEMIENLNDRLESLESRQEKTVDMIGAMKNTLELHENMLELHTEMLLGHEEESDVIGSLRNLSFSISSRIREWGGDNTLAVIWFFIVLLTIVNWVQIKLLLLSIWHWF